MTMFDGEQHEDRELWRLMRRPEMSPRVCPDAMDLAAYADRTGGDEQRQRIESHLAECGECLATIRDAIERGGRIAMDQTAITPDAVPIAAAVPGPATRHALSRHGRVSPFVLRISGWSLAAAASVLISIIAFQAGSMLTGDPVAAESDESLVATMTFGLASDTGATQGDLLTASEAWQ